jgi:adenylate cyclase
MIVCTGCTYRWTFSFITTLLCLSFFSIRVRGASEIQNPENARQKFISISDSARMKGNFDRAIAYLDSALRIREKIPHQVLSQILLKKAFLLEIKSKFSEALTLLFAAKKICLETNNIPDLADVYNHIGAIHHNLGDFEKAASYYESSLELYRKLDKKKEMARGYNNFGSLAEDMNKPEKALFYHRKSREIWQSLGKPGFEGVNFMHLGVCHDLLGQTDSAIFYLGQSVKTLESMKDNQNLALVYNLLGNAYYKGGQIQNAKKWCEKGLAISKQLLVVRYQAKSCDCLFNVYEDLGDLRKALFYHKQSVLLRDSVYNEQKAKEITRIEMDHGFQQRQFADSLETSVKKQKEELKFQQDLTREKEKRNVSIFAGILFLFLAGGLWNRLYYVRKSRALLSDEKEKSEKLLLKILPAEIVEELKEHGKSEGRDHNDVSILFVDVKDFTGVALKMTPKELVSEINTCFEAFDAITESHGLEKIKTIGDSYMAAAGVPAPKKDGARQTILASLAIQEYLKDRKKIRDAEGLPSFEMRAGIHTGHVVAGVVGSNKFQYDIWGDAVNTASRMETSGEAGKVNISGTTYEMVKDDPDFQFDFRGAIKAKGKGLLDMYFVELAGKKLPGPDPVV